jgi:hypothetical protein
MNSMTRSSRAENDVLALQPHFPGDGFAQIVTAAIGIKVRAFEHLAHRGERLG